MLKRLLNLFGASVAITLMCRDFSNMLDLSYATAVPGGQPIFSESPEPHHRTHSFKRSSTT